MQIKAAEASDCQALKTLWNPVIQDSDITFNSELKTSAGLRLMLEEKHALNHPFLLVKREGVLVGFATYGAFRSSNGYRHSVEHSIILAPQARGLGIGRRLMWRLEELAKAQGQHVMIAGISASNQAAIGFHKALNYLHVGHLPQVGYKFGRWHDLILMQKTL